MTKRRAFIRLLGAVVGAGPLSAYAQPAPSKQIAYLSSGDRVGSAELTAAFLQSLRELGYVDGKNIVVASRYAEGNVSKLRVLATELVSLKPDVFFAPTGVSVEAVKSVTTAIPIVFAWIADPVGSGYVSSLAHPGTNVTGLSTLSAGLALKRLELVREALPTASRIAVLFHASVPGNVSQEQQTHAEGKALGIEILSVPVTKADDLERVFSTITTVRPDALIILENPVTFVYRERIMHFVMKAGLPVISDSQFYPPAGALLSYAVDMALQFRRAAVYVDKILKGANPANLPVEQPTNFELVINLKSAKALGVAMPQSLVLRANSVIR
jgi:putative tryptophan/tyrosine transport system substrate-binding protein